MKIQIISLYNKENNQAHDIVLHLIFFQGFKDDNSRDILEPIVFRYIQVANMMSTS